ncbi:hypothetical protein ACWWJF_20080 [Symbiopectobacterium sp. Eva_TO]
MDIYGFLKSIYSHRNNMLLSSASLYIAGGLQSYSRLIDDVNKALDKK